MSYICLHYYTRMSFTCIKQVISLNNLRCSLQQLRWLWGHSFESTESIVIRFALIIWINATPPVADWLIRPPNGNVLLIAPQTYVPTVFENYTACLELEDQRVELSLWDTSGKRCQPKCCTQVRLCTMNVTSVCSSWLKWGKSAQIISESQESH